MGCALSGDSRPAERRQHPAQQAYSTGDNDSLSRCDSSPHHHHHHSNKSFEFAYRNISVIQHNLEWIDALEDLSSDERHQIKQIHLRRQLRKISMSSPGSLASSISFEAQHLEQYPTIFHDDDDDDDDSDDGNKNNDLHSDLNDNNTTEACQLGEQEGSGCCGGREASIALEIQTTDDYLPPRGNHPSRERAESGSLSRLADSDEVITSERVGEKPHTDWLQQASPPPGALRSILRKGKPGKNANLSVSSDAKPQQSEAAKGDESCGGLSLALSPQLASPSVDPQNWLIDVTSPTPNLLTPLNRSATRSVRFVTMIDS